MTTTGGTDQEHWGRVKERLRAEVGDAVVNGAAVDLDGDAVGFDLQAFEAGQARRARMRLERGPLARDRSAVRRQLFAHHGQREAGAVAEAQHGLPDSAVLGPTPAFYRRARGRFRWQIILKGEGSRILLREAPLPRGWVVDVDPLHVL